MNIVKRSNIRINTTKNNTIERHPVKILGVDYRVKITYKAVKIAELDVENKTIKITLQNKYKKIENKQMLDFAIEKMYEQIAKVEIERAMEKARILLGFAPEDYKISKLKDGYGKCENNIITIDPRIVKYKREIIDYIVIHEYCHLKYKRHTKGFKELLAKYEPEYEKYEEITK